MLVGRLLALALVGITWEMPGCRQSQDCIHFDSEPISAGRSYSHPMQHRLVFRFTAEAGRGLESHEQVWHLTVGPEGSTDQIDYVWPVSLPINSTHHLFVGPGLDWSAGESVAINPRRLRFVLTPQDLKKAETVYAHATRQVIAGSAFDSQGLRELGKGELTVTLREAAVNAGRIESITLAVRACVPREAPVK